MTWQVFLFGILPLIVFVVVDVFATFKIAVISSIAAAVIETAWTYFYFHEVDQMTWIALILAIGLGLVAYKLDNSKIFKFQPVVLGVMLAVTVAYFQYFDQPILLKFLPKMRLYLSEDQLAIVNSPENMHRMGVLSERLIYVFLTHALLVALAALKMSTMSWFLIRSVGIYILLIAAVLIPVQN